MIISNMEFDLEILTDAELAECKRVAVERVKIQMKDAKNGMRNASYSYGRADAVDSRTFERRIRHAMMGALAEFIGSKCAKCDWPKEIGQYKGNRNPDLKPKFKGQVVNCDARGSNKYSTFIYRPRDVKNPDGLLIAVTNLPDGPVCQVGHAFFRDISKLADGHPEWLGSHPGEPYYEIPFKFLSEDFSEFGK
jgi:hypothetical protein